LAALGAANAADRAIHGPESIDVIQVVDPCGMTTGMGFEAERTRDLAVDDRNLVRPGTDFSILRQKRDPPRRVTRD